MPSFPVYSPISTSNDSASQKDAGLAHTESVQDNVSQRDTRGWDSLRSRPLFQKTPIQTQAAENFAQVSSTANQKNSRGEPKPLESKTVSEHRRRPPFPTRPTIKYPSFISKRTNSISQWLLGRRYVSLWWLEAICCGIALGALLATVATIRTHDSKPLPRWKYGLTINAIIAIYTVILKAAAGLVLAEGISHLKWIAVSRPQPLSTFVAHDDASRGPWGALMLLCKNNYRSGKFRVLPFVSSLGALVTVLMLLLDPFSQQIVRTYQCEREVTGEVGTIARTNMYTEAGNHSAAGLATIPFSVRGAVYNGLFASQKPEVLFNCRTGNCTFANKYSSAAYCSICNDTTDRLQFVQDTNGKNVTLPLQFGNLTLEHRGSDGSAMVSSSSGGDVDMIRWTGSDESGTETFRAYHCNLFPCIKTFEASISKARLEESVVEETGMVFSLVAPLNHASAADLHCLDNLGQREILKRLGYQFEDTTRWLPYNVSLDEGTTEHPVYAQDTSDNPCKRAPGNQYPDLCTGGLMTNKALEAVPAQCIYNIGTTATNSLETNLFPGMFEGVVTMDFYQHPVFSGTDALAAIYIAGSETGTLEDVQGIMRNMTDAITTHMRQAGDEGFSEPAAGEMYDSITCILVRWGWLSYAVTVVGLLLVFFAWMVVYARIDQSRLRSQWTSDNSVPSIYDFKSSALTVLFHGLNGQSLTHMEDVGASNRERDSEKKAKEVTVKFVATNQGWKLSSVDP